MRVLLAEDNAIARTALAGGLRGQGYDVELAEDGEEALERIRQLPPDIVITDVLMPRMDGYSLCRAIKEDPSLNAIPVVFYSGTFVTEEDRQLAESVGASRILHKSADILELNTALHEVLDEFAHAELDVPHQPLRSGEEIDKFYENVISSKLAAKVNELEAEKRALSKSEQRYYQLVSTIPDVIFVLSLPEFNTTYIAPDAERLVGVPGEEMLGDASRWLAMIYEDDRGRLMQQLNEALENKRGVNTVFRMYHRAGGYRWIEGHTSIVLDDDGVPREMLGVLNDITERKLSEEKLVESERSLATLFSNLPGMAYRRRNIPEWTMAFVSDGVEAVTGYTRAEVVGNAVVGYNNLIHPEDQPRVWEEIQQAIGEGRQFSLSYRIRHKDGKLRWVWERGVGVDDGERGEQWVEGFIADITLRKRAEERLIDSERRYRNLFEMMENGMAVHELVYDAQGTAVDYRFLEVNPAYEQLLGVAAERIIGCTARQVPSQIESKWIEEYIEVVRSGVPKRFVRYYADRDRYYDVVVFRNAEKQFVTLFSDITEKRKHEEEIRNLAKFPEENPSPVLRITTEGLLLYMNPAAELMRSYWDLQQGKPLSEKILKKIRKAQQTDDRYLCDLGERWFSFLIRPVDEAGYINIYGREVTDEQLAQQELVSLNRVLQMMSEGNRTLVHAQTEESLLKNICKVITQEGDYPVAWVSVPREDSRSLHCVAEDGELKGAVRAWGWHEVGLTDSAHPVTRAYSDNNNLILSTGNGSAKAYQLDKAMKAIGIRSVFLLPMCYQDQVFGIIGIFSRTPLELNLQERSLLDELASDIGYGVQSHRTKMAHIEGVQRLNSAMMHTIEAVSIALEKRDPYTAGHQKRVAALSIAIAHEMGFSEDRIEGIRLGSMVHDIGKISVPAEILNRPGRLSPDEFGIIKAHPEAGYDILKGVDFPWPIAQMIIQHHERMDGSGYPHGLRGEAIAEEARILAVADVVEAITSHRPYRPSLGIEIALEEIENGRGTAYDPAVVDACLRLFREKGFEWEIE